MENEDIDKHYTAFCSVCGKPMPVFAKEKPSDDTVFTHNKCKQLTDIDKAAREYSDECNSYAPFATQSSFRAGAEWMKTQMQSEIDELREALEEMRWIDPRAKKPKKDVSVLIQYVDGIELGCYCGYGEWHCPNSYYSPDDKPISWRPINTPKATQLLEKYGKK